MAYALKSTGQALDLVSCVLVDDDGTTIVDLCGNALTKHANVSVGEATWKGQNRKFFETKGSGYNAYNITYDTPPNVSTHSDDADGMAVFCALAGSGAGGGSAGAQTYVGIHTTASATHGLKRGGSGGAYVQFRQGSSTSGTGNTSLPTDLTTKFSIAANWHAGVGVQVFYGLESGSLAADSGVEATGTWGSNAAAVQNIGSHSGQGYMNAKFHVVCVFKSKRTLQQMQALHNDWFGELIESGGGGGIPSAPSQSATTEITQTSATANWVHTGNLVTVGFEVRIQTPPNTGPLTLVDTVGPEARSCPLPGLSPGTQYRVVTRAIGDGGPSAYSSGHTFTTAAATPVSESITLSPDPAVAVIGATTAVTITRSAPAPSGGVTYNLSIGSGVGTVPATATISAGLTTTSFNVTGVSAGSTTVTATNAADSNETDSITVNVVAAPVAKIKALAHADALGKTGVKGLVLRAGEGGRLSGRKIGEIEGAAFGSSAESGKAPLVVDLAEVIVGVDDEGVGDLTTSDTLVLYLQDADDHSPLLPATIIED